MVKLNQNLRGPSPAWEGCEGWTFGWGETRHGTGETSRGRVPAAGWVVSFFGGGRFYFCFFPFGFGGPCLDRNQQQKKTATTPTNLKGEGIRGDALRWWARGVEAVIGDEFFWIKGWFPPQKIMPLKKMWFPLDLPVRLLGSTSVEKRGSTYGIGGNPRCSGGPVLHWSVQFCNRVIWDGRVGQEEARIKKKKDDESTLMREQHTWQMVVLGGNWGVGRWGLEDESGEEEGTIMMCVSVVLS